MCVYLCGCMKANRLDALNAELGNFALITHVNWILNCLKKVSVKHQRGKERENIARTSVCAVGSSGRCLWAERGSTHEYE